MKKIKNVFEDPLNKEKIREAETTQLWRNRKRLTFHNGYLYYTSRKNNLLTLLVPHNCRKLVATYYHGKDTCHSGAEKTYLTIRELMFWKNMYKEISDIVSRCSHCQLDKRQKFPNKAPLVPILPTKRFETWHIDIAGPMPTSENGHHFILIFVEPFSK